MRVPFFWVGLVSPEQVVDGCVSSDKAALPVAERAAEVPASANILSQEERLLPEAQLR